MKLVIATSVNGLSQALEDLNKYEIVSTLSNMNDLRGFYNNNLDSIDTLLVTENLEGRGSITDLLVQLKKDYPLLRIVYLSSSGLQTEHSINQLIDLVEVGIYDIFYKNATIGIKTIEKMIDNPANLNDCQKILEAKQVKLNNNEKVNKPQKTKEIIVAEVEESTAKDNVYLVTSVKPGTGKSFVAANLSATLAKYGRTKNNGFKPKVLLLEGDLQTLSISTLFGLKNDAYNLKTSLQKVSLFMKGHTLDQWNSEESFDVKNHILKSCIEVPNIESLYILEGHDFDFKDISDVNTSDYYYMLDYLSTQFDVVIVDGNSSLQHKTTDALLQLSKNIFLVFTTDFNNVKLNLKYMDAFDKLQVSYKTKYVLNKALSEEEQQKYSHVFNYSDEEILNNAIQIDYRIPLIDLSVIYNSIYNRNPIATDTDFSTLIARLKFLQLAKDVYPLENIDMIIEEVEDLKRNVSGKKKSKRSKLKKK